MSADTNSANSTQPPAADRSANRTDPDRNLALELVRATEAAAIACSRYMGFGDKEQVDQAAVDAMRPVLGSVRMNGGREGRSTHAVQRRARRRRHWAPR